MHYLVELDALDGAGQPETLRYSDHGLTTLPTDTPPNAPYDPYVREPGNVERHLYSDGRTFGDVSVGAGVTRLVNTGGGLDHLRLYAFDGRAIRIYGLASLSAPFASRRLLLEGVVAQTEFESDEFIVTVRDWLEALRQPLQAETYKGTTVAGGLPEAEGGEDLKDKTKPMLWGGPVRGIPAILEDAFDLVLGISEHGCQVVHGVFDMNVPLGGRGDFPTLAALKAATLKRGEFATCNALGKIRLGGSPVGAITVDASEGASPAARTAGQIARRMLLKAGNVEGVDFLGEDIAALDIVAPYPCGVWFGVDGVRPSDKDAIEQPTGTTTLQALSFVLQSVRASIAPDFSGVYRIRQIPLPDPAKAVGILDEDELPGIGDYLDHSAPGDQRDGLPVKRVVLRFGFNHSVASPGDLDTATTPERRTFALQQWRQVSVVAEDTAARHLGAHTLVRDTALVSQADAEVEAAAVLALYRVPRVIQRETLPTSEVAAFDLSDILTVRASRFGLSEGRAFVAIGRVDEFASGHTTLVLWG